MEAVTPDTQGAANPIIKSIEDQTLAEAGVASLLRYLGEDLHREGLRDTPRRVVRALKEMTAGYEEDPAELLTTRFSSDYDQLIVVKHIEFVSLCEHHMLPFTGVVHVGYLPKGKVVGLSKIPRVVRCFARRLQIQEHLTEQIAHAIGEHLQPLGVGVVIEATHQCMSCRGIMARNATMVTSCLLGRVRTAARAEFLSLVDG